MSKPMTDDEAREKAWVAHENALMTRSRLNLVLAEEDFNAGWKAAIEHERSKREAPSREILDALDVCESCIRYTEQYTSFPDDGSALATLRAALGVEEPVVDSRKGKHMKTIEQLKALPKTRVAAKAELGEHADVLQDNPEAVRAIRIFTEHVGNGLTVRESLIQTVRTLASAALQDDAPKG